MRTAGDWVDFEVMEEFTEHSGIHGLHRIRATKSITSKLAWVLVTLVSGIACAFCLHWVLTDFADAPTVTSTETIVETEMTAPTITVCQDRAISYAFKAKYNVSNDLAYYIQSLIVPRTWRAKDLGREKSPQLPSLYGLS